MLATRGDLLSRAEGAMNGYRATIAPGDDFVSGLLGAAMILLREGLEAMLVVVAMVAFLRKAGREDVKPYIHAGWVGALAAAARRAIASSP